MKAGSTGYFKVLLGVDMTIVSSIIFTMKSNKDIIQKDYPGDVSYNEEDGKFYIPLDQYDTTNLQGYVDVEAQINFLDGGVTKSGKQQTFVKSTLATRFMKDNVPAELADVDLDVEPIQIVHTGGGGDAYTKAESDAKYATKTALADKADKSEIPTDYATTEQLQAVAEQIPTDYATKAEVEEAGRELVQYVDSVPLKTINGESIKGSGDIVVKADVSEDVIAEKVDEYLVKHPIEGATVEYVNALDAEKFDKTEPQGENYNLLGVDDCSITATDVTLTVEDGVFTLNGTAGAVRELSFKDYLKSPLLPSGNYYVMSEKLGGSNTGNYPTFQYASGKTTVISTATKPVMATFAVDMSRAKLAISSGASFTDYKFHLWINSEADGLHEYQPYGEGGGSGETIYSLKPSVEIPRLDEHSEDTDLHFTAEEKAWMREQIGGADAVFANEITDTAQKCFAESGEECLSFAFMADTHTYMSDETSVKQYDDMIQHVKAVDTAYPFDFMVHCGDFVNTQWLWQYNTITDAQYQQTVAHCANKLRKSGIKDIFCPMGNHDSGYLGNNAEYSANSLNYKNVQRAYNEKGVVVRDGANPWFYVDYPNHKVRCLFISTSVNSTTSEVKGIHYNEALWLKATFESLEDDWNVLMFGHISFARFWTAMNRESTSAFVSIVNGFNAHTTVDLSGDKLDCNFTSKSGKVLAYFCGHYHGDSIILPSDTRAKLACPEISISAGGYRSSGVITTGDWYDSSDAPSREYGTVTQDAWDAVVVKLTSNEIKLVRFGAGDDRTVIIG